MAVTRRELFPTVAKWTLGGAVFLGGTVATIILAGRALEDAREKPQRKTSWSRNGYRVEDFGSNDGRFEVTEARSVVGSGNELMASKDSRLVQTGIVFVVRPDGTGGRNYFLAVLTEEGPEELPLPQEISSQDKNTNPIIKVSSREGDITYSLSYALAPDGQDLLELRTARFKGKRSVTAPLRVR